jgi:2'-hydroxyisoflavone reductase
MAALWSRRRFLGSSAAAAASLAFGGLGRARPLVGATPRKILVLGGTSFLGPAFVEEAVVAGHRVTLFNRGITNPELFPYLEKLRGLRSPKPSEEDWSALSDRRWDVVVDVWPNEPSLAETAAKRLVGRAGHYLYVSSIAAYERSAFAVPGITEDARLEPFDSNARPYNRNKAESERRLHSLVPDHLTIVRPGPIKGIRDDTPDVARWLWRAREGSRHIGPGTGEDHVQLVDVKDVARFLVLAIERSLFGTFNLTGEARTFRQFLDACVRAVRSKAEFVWIPLAFLREEGLDADKSVYPPENFPLWDPEPRRKGFFQISSRRAFDAGWTTRPFVETSSDILWSFESMTPKVARTDPLPPEVERRVLAEWSRRSS